MSRVDVTAADDLTAGYPQRTAARVHLRTHDGREFSREQDDYEGSPTRPMSWDRVVDKFWWLAGPFCERALGDEIIAAIARLDEIPVATLTGLLGAVSPTARRPRSGPRF